MPSNTQYTVSNRNDYSSKDLILNFRGAVFDLSTISDINCDFLLSDDCVLDGMVISVLNSVFGEKISFQVVDKDNILGFGPGIVLGTFVTDWFIDPSSSKQADSESNYPAKVKAGLYLRIKYTSLSVDLNKKLIVNYKLHKILW